MGILVLDDEIEIADLVELYLQSEGYHVYKCYTANEALKVINEEQIDLAILDVMVEGIDGFEFVKIIRDRNLTFPIIMLTAKIQDQDKIKGLSLGADDYITKPFNPLELIARVKACLRRYTKYTPNNKDAEIVINGLTIDKNAHKCFLYDKEVILTPIEFDILVYLASNQGHVISSEELFEQVWKDKYLDNNNTVMVHIRRIRKKLKDDSKEPKYIKTVWGVGYKIDN